MNGTVAGGSSTDQSPRPFERRDGQSETAKILFDGHHLSVANATGIGTYARTLATTVRAIGYGTGVLISSNATKDRKDPQFSEVAFFDPLTTQKRSIGTQLGLLSGLLFGKPFGLRPSKFQRLGSVIDAPFSEQMERLMRMLAHVDTVYTAPELFELARLHFKRHRV